MDAKKIFMAISMAMMNRPAKEAGPRYPHNITIATKHVKHALHDKRQINAQLLLVQMILKVEGRIN